MNWEKLGSSSKNCEKLTIPAEPSLEVPTLNILMTWEILCLTLNFIAGNKMGNLHKAGHISTLT